MTQLPQSWQFSLFYKEGLGIKNTIPLKTIDLNRLIEIYSSDHLVKKYQDIVNAPTDHYKKWIKDHYLPYITPNGVFAPKRADENITHYNSNLLVLDIDNLSDKAIEIQQRLSKEKGCVMCVLSPRLEGVQGILDKSAGFHIDKILFVGGNDILHIDTPRRTTTSGTPQDTDGMWYRNFLTAKQLYVEILEKLIALADVHFVFNPSNHDYTHGFFLADCIKTHFRQAANITFDCSLQHRKAYRYGENLIGTTHGDGAKQQDLLQKTLLLISTIQIEHLLSHQL